MITKHEQGGDEQEHNTQANPDILPFIEREAELHPSPEMLLIRMAIDKALMNKQREVWYMYAYDKLTFVEIGKKLGVSGSSAQKQVKTIERQIFKWCKSHQEVYKALKEAEASND